MIIIFCLTAVIGTSISEMYDSIIGTLKINRQTREIFLFFSKVVLEV